MIGASCEEVVRWWVVECMPGGDLKIFGRERIGSDEVADGEDASQFGHYKVPTSMQALMIWDRQRIKEIEASIEARHAIYHEQINRYKSAVHRTLLSRG